MKLWSKPVSNSKRSSSLQKMKWGFINPWSWAKKAHLFKKQQENWHYRLSDIFTMQILKNVKETVQQKSIILNQFVIIRDLTWCQQPQLSINRGHLLNVTASHHLSTFSVPHSSPNQKLPTLVLWHSQQIKTWILKQERLETEKWEGVRGNSRENRDERFCRLKDNRVLMISARESSKKSEHWTTFNHNNNW